MADPLSRTRRTQLTHNGVRQWRTVSGGSFDRLLGVLILVLRGASANVIICNQSMSVLAVRFVTGEGISFVSAFAFE
jgi:hypothetical protein